MFHWCRLLQRSFYMCSTTWGRASGKTRSFWLASADEHPSEQVSPSLPVGKLTGESGIGEWLVEKSSNGQGWWWIRSGTGFDSAVILGLIDFHGSKSYTSDWTYTGLSSPKVCAGAFPGARRQISPYPENTTYCPNSPVEYDGGCITTDASPCRELGLGHESL